MYNAVILYLLRICRSIQVLQKEQVMDKLKTKNRFLFTATVLLYIIMLLIYSLWDYTYRKSKIIENIDSKLYNTAVSLKYILPDDFHDRAIDEHAILINEDKYIAHKLTKLVKETGFKYLYSIVKKRDRLFFVACDIVANPETKRGTFYFYPYDDADESFIRAFEQDTPTYKAVTDQWGTVRTVMVPETSPGGIKYLACADFDITYVNGLIKKNLLRAIAIILFFLLLPVPIIVIYKKSINDFLVALQESEKKYRLLADNSADVIWTLDMDLNSTYTSPSIENLLGYTVQEAIDKPLSEKMTLPSIEKINNAFMEELALEEKGDADPSRSMCLELEQICKDNSTVWVESTVNFIRDEEGKAIGILGITRNISDRRQAEEAIRSSHKRFLTVLDSIDATIYVSDMETYEILFANQCMKESFGRDMTGEICWAVFRGLSGPCPDCTNDQLIDENGFPTGVCVWQGKNPITEKHYINYDRAIEWTDGHLVRIQIATDITNLKRMEQQLQQTQKYQAIGTLAGGIAHDFNNLLMGIQGRTSLMSIDLEPSHSHSEHIKAIEEYIQSASDLTKQILGVARGGKYEVTPIDINELVDKSANMFGRTKKEIRIHTKLQNPAPVVKADRAQIEQVLLNLYVNAWQAMLDGGELYLETQTVALDEAYCKPYEAKPGDYAKVSVTDTGVGMDEDTRRQVFDPFYTTKEKSRGTGLGLASAYGIIKNHNGFITVYSAISHGTTFNIYLPLSDNKAYRVVPMADEVVKGSETILLVDDEKIVLDVGKEMLGALGYHVVVAYGGEKAIDVIQNKGDEIDLVILDLIMPGMDGGKVFDRIKEILPAIMVMLSSGYAINGQAEEILKRGCNGFIQKPFNLSELSQKIRKILDGEKSSTQG